MRRAAGHPPSTQLSFSLASPGTVRIFVYNMKGERIRNLADGEKPAGGYRISWDGRSDDGIPVASGIYLVRMEAGGWTECRKMLLIR
ncbi:hypothetical protein JW906_04135 [bacterium]|nr:hypothetical protein [bacterium]